MVYHQFPLLQIAIWRNRHTKYHIYHQRWFDWPWMVYPSDMMVPMVPRQEHCSPVPVLCIGGCNWRSWASLNVVTTWVGCPRYPQISPEQLIRIWDLIFLGQNARRLSAGLYYLCRFSGPAVYSSENLVEKYPEISWNYITMVGLGLSCNIVLVIEIILDNMINIDQW